MKKEQGNHGTKGQNFVVLRHEWLVTNYQKAYVFNDKKYIPNYISGFASLLPKIEKKNHKLLWHK